MFDSRQSRVEFSGSMTRVALFSVLGFIKSNPKWRPATVATILENFQWRYLRGSSDPLHPWFLRTKHEVGRMIRCGDIGFSRPAYLVHLLPVELNPRGGRRPSWKISNEYVSGVCGLWNGFTIHSPLSRNREQLCRNMGENNARGVIRLVTI